MNSIVAIIRSFEERVFFGPQGSCAQPVLWQSILILKTWSPQPIARITADVIIMGTSHVWISSCKTSSPEGITEKIPRPAIRLRILTTVGSTQQKTWLNSDAKTAQKMVFCIRSTVFLKIRYAFLHYCQSAMQQNLKHSSRVMYSRVMIFTPKIVR